jgi:hypothetical protein
VFVLGGGLSCFFFLPDFDAIARSETPELRKSVCFCWRWEFIFLLLFGVFFPNLRESRSFPHRLWGRSDFEGNPP